MSSMSYYKGLFDHMPALNAQYKSSEDQVNYLLAIVQSLPDAICSIDLDWNIRSWNKGAEHMLGYTPEEIIGKSIAIIIPQDIFEKEVEHCINILNTEGILLGYETIRKAKGERIIPVELTAVALKDESQNIVSYAAIMRDISERKLAEQALHKAYNELELRVQERTMELAEANERLRGVLSSITDAYFSLDAQWRFLEINPVAERYFGRPAHELLEKNIWEECPWATYKEFYRQYQSAIESKQPVHFEGFAETAGRWLEVHAYPRPDRLEIYFRDITGRKQMEETITYQASHDILTGLPNRALFMEHLDHELNTASRYKEKLAVLFMDLDQFKIVNDSLGHAIGDALLKAVADRLKLSVREADIVARMGGDEYTILLPDIRTNEDIIRVAQKILSQFKQPFSANGHELPIGVSIGISIFPHDGEDANALLKNADVAMYHIKEHGRNHYEFYNPDMAGRTLQRIALENSLRQTLERGELVVYYQPVIAVAARCIVGAEALVRWQHPERGLLDPMHFIPLAEETGLIEKIDERVIRTACAQAMAWQHVGFPPLFVTVNLSDRLFQRPDLADIVAQALQNAGLAPEFLELEINESLAMKNIEMTLPGLLKLAESGVRLAIDDFGTGYSSLSYLKRLPVQKVKIDISLVHGLPDDPNDQAIVNAIVAMAQNLHLKVSAEGVEAKEQFSFLQSRGCDEAQGFLLGEPLPAEAFRELLIAQEEHFS